MRAASAWATFFLLLFFFLILSSDLDMDDDLNSDDYEYEDEAKLVIFPDHYEIALPNIEELPALVSECACGCMSCVCVCVCVLVCIVVHSGAHSCGHVCEGQKTTQRVFHQCCAPY